MSELSILKSCDNCGACCLEQQSPPGCVILLSSEEMMSADEFGQDVFNYGSRCPNRTFKLC